MLVFPACSLREPASTFDEEDIQEAVLRWAFTNAETDLQPAAAYCLVFAPAAGQFEDSGIEDPPPSFLERFRGMPVPVRPLSACRFGAGELGGSRHVVVDTVTGGHGLLFEYGPVETRADGAAVVGVGYVQGGEWGRGWECVVMQSDTGWAVDHCRVLVDI